MIDLDQLRTTLKAMNLSKIAEETGVPYGRIHRLTHTTTRPSFETVKAVVDYLESLKIVVDK